MIRIFTLAAAALTAAATLPADALAHTDGHAHAEMTVVSELAHMLGDPLHLGLLAASVAAGALVWKALRKKDSAARTQAD